MEGTDTHDMQQKEEEAKQWIEEVLGEKVTFPY
jgi:hypothetical protein